MLSFSFSDLKTISELNNKLVLALIAISFFLQFGYISLPDNLEIIITPGTHISIKILGFAITSFCIMAAAFIFYNLVGCYLNVLLNELLFPIAGGIFISFGLLAFAKTDVLFSSINHFWYITSISIGFFLLDTDKELQELKKPQKR